MFQRFFSGDNLCSCVQFLLQLRYLYFRFLLRTRINFTCVDGWYKNGGICEHCAVENASCTGPDDYVCWAGYYDENGVCNACPENATCNGGNEYFHCNSGYYKYQSICLSCAGHLCDGDILIKLWGWLSFTL